MLTKMGLIGLYNGSNFRENISSVYMISDEETASLFVFILFPGSYHDVYEIASLTAYQNIFLIPISIYPEYISDVYRLVNELTPIKARVKVMSPDALMPPIKNVMSSMMLNAFVKGSTKSSFVYSKNGFIAFDWKGGDDDECSCEHLWPSNYHDIYCTFGDKRVLLTVNKVDRQRILSLVEKDYVDYIYVPWQNGSGWCVNGITEENSFREIFDELYKIGKAHMVIPYGFPNSTAIDICREHYEPNFPIIARNLFIDYNPVGIEWLSNLTFAEAVRSADTHHHIHHHHDHRHHIHHYPTHPPHCEHTQCATCAMKDQCSIYELLNKQPPKPDPMSVKDIAFVTMDSMCPEFTKWALSEAHTCEECELKTYLTENDITLPEEEVPVKPSEPSETPNPTEPDPTDPTPENPKDGSETEKTPSTGDTNESGGSTEEPADPVPETPEAGTSTGETTEDVTTDTSVGEAVSDSSDQEQITEPENTALTNRFA